MGTKVQRQLVPGATRTGWCGVDGTRIQGHREQNFSRGHRRPQEGEQGRDKQEDFSGGLNGYVRPLPRTTCSILTRTPVMPGGPGSPSSPFIPSWPFSPCSPSGPGSPLSPWIRGQGSRERTSKTRSSQALHLRSPGDRQPLSCLACLQYWSQPHQGLSLEVLFWW